MEPGGLQTVTAADGGYSFTGFAPGNYTIYATVGGRCGLAGSGPVEIDGQGNYLELYLFPHTDDLGHTCSEQTATFSTAGNALALTGDNAVTSVNLPFAFPFYGSAYRNAWVDTNGLLSFTDPGGSHPYPGGGQLPAPADPNALLAPFWDDLVVDASASVRTATTGTGDDQRFTVEWRNVHRKGNTAQRLNFAAVLAPDGTVTTSYDQLDNDAERGANALVGIEAPAGEDGLPYSADEPVLTTGRTITFARPAAVDPLKKHNSSGTLVDAAGNPVVGATVALDPSGLTPRPARVGRGASPVWSPTATP
ncbi:hypothetical protein KBX06_26380 [Micromonospora sp. C31]|uniref:hypothetical protein n=1 Tax=Micromonospora sp. C31 TaxID=2824876 RepID=UPI001B364336|nr:hypothetical protein [Micromonospora sp. C31]MBQ1076654.1 hypothetical protein [Micromonospora sp. C31]